jgi:hypothetical protein
VAAFGVAPKEDRPNDYRLAVRIFKGQERLARPMLERLQQGRAELDIAKGVRYEPRLTLRAGGSCGHVNITAGTLGAFVQDADYYYVLSNNHVLADCDNGRPGDPILQPGPGDIRGGRFHVIANLSHAVPLNFQTVDAAVASFSDDVQYFYPWTYTGIGDISPRPIEDRFSVSRVIKRGITTGVTRGTVSVFELDGVTIDYGDDRHARLITFDNQIEVIGAPPSRPFSQPGDSGSLIIDRDTLRPYALLYGGGPDDEGIDRTVAHFIPEVLDSLEVQFVPG